MAGPEIPELIDRLGRQIADLLPDSVRGARDELQRNIGAVLQQAFSRMELVSREEFDTQREVLARTREKLEQLEQQVRELEERARPG